MTNADRRSVTTDALDTLGEIIDASQKRDAIHLAVEPVIAGEGNPLRAGQHVGLIRGVAQIAAWDDCVGIVDPFLKHHVKPGERFWLVVYPRQIHSLRHVWTHPKFPEVPELSDLQPDPVKSAQIKKDNVQYYHKTWVENFCRTHDCPGYETLVESVMRNHDPDYLIIQGEDAHGDIPAELWDHLEKALDRKIDVRPESFSCSC